MLNFSFFSVDLFVVQHALFPLCLSIFQPRPPVTVPRTFVQWNVILLIIFAKTLPDKGLHISYHKRARLSVPLLGVEILLCIRAFLLVAVY